jgi:hypothetical protein
MVNSKQKGARAERQAAAHLRELGHTKARRGRQYHGGPESPDLADAVPGVHFEVKHTERLELWKAIKQAEEDCGLDVPVVMFKRNRNPWHLAVRAEYMTHFALNWLINLGFHVGDPPPWQSAGSPKPTSSTDTED